MKLGSIRKYLRPSTIMSRKSTVSGAFASALSPYDEYNVVLISEAIMDLGQDPEGDLLCVYCGAEAATWDHVFNRVVKGEFSGYGHLIRNLVPCCRSCNERKGAKTWRHFLDILNPPDKDARVCRMTKFLDSADARAISTEAMRHKASSELQEFLNIRAKVFELMAEADKLAVAIRNKAKNNT